MLNEVNTAIQPKSKQECVRLIWTILRWHCARNHRSPQCSYCLFIKSSQMISNVIRSLKVSLYFFQDFTLSDPHDVTRCTVPTLWGSLFGQIMITRWKVASAAPVTSHFFGAWWTFLLQSSSKAPKVCSKACALDMVHFRQVTWD